jgi:DNA-binding MarR family transcriptional regulator
MVYRRRLYVNAPNGGYRDPVAEDGDRRDDLGVLLGRLMRRLLAAHEVEMWDYAVLVELETGPAQTQARLAGAIGRDKTRLIQSLDRLEARGLVVRAPDPADRRNRTVTLTAAGLEVLRACRAAIRAMEDELLAGVAEADRAPFLRALRQLAPAQDS